MKVTQKSLDLHLAILKMMETPKPKEIYSVTQTHSEILRLMEISKPKVMETLKVMQMHSDLYLGTLKATRKPKETLKATRKPKEILKVTPKLTETPKPKEISKVTRKLTETPKVKATLMLMVKHPCLIMGNARLSIFVHNQQ